MTFVQVMWLVVSGAISGSAAFVATQAASYWWHRWRSRRLRQGLARYEKEHGRKEVALLLSTRNSIKEAAEDYLKKTGKGPELPVFEVHQAVGFEEKEGDWAVYLERVKGEVRKIQELGVHRVYLFANVPLAMAFFAGAVLLHGPEVVVHHYTSGHYFPVGSLTVGTIRL